MSLRVTPGTTRKRRATRLGDPYGRVFLVDAAAGYLHPALRAAYTRSGAALICPQADGSLLPAGSNNVAREWLGGRWCYRLGPGFTQMMLRSGNIANNTWSKVGLLAPVQDAVGPNGAQDSWAIVEDTTAGPSHWVSQSLTTVAGTSYTLMGVCSDRTGNRFLQLIQLSAQFGVTQIGCFDPRTGTFNLAGGCTGGMVPLGYGNWLCWITAVATAAASAGPMFRLSNSAAANPPTYAGDGVSGLNLYGAYCTDTAFLPPLVNAAGSVSVASAPSWQTPLASLGISLPGDYTFGCDLVTLDMAGAYTTRAGVQLDAGGASERSALRLGTSGAGAARSLVVTGGATVHAGAVGASGGLLRMAQRVSAAAPRLACNGVLDAAGAGIVLPTAPTHVRIGHDDAGAAPMVGGIARWWVSPRAFNNAELQACTA